MPEPDRSRARQLAAESFAHDDPAGWFDRLYQEAAQGTTVIPWADLKPNPNLIEWWNSQPAVTLKGATALVVGCGLGDDAEQLAAWGARVTAIDISPTAIAAARRRFPETSADYRTADLLNPPPGQFDFVFEAYTIQALPANVRKQAIEGVAGFVAPSGALLVITRGRDDNDPPGDMPWPLSPSELAQIDHLGLLRLTFDDYLDGSTRRFRVLYRRL